MAGVSEREGRKRLRRLVEAVASILRHRTDVRAVLGPERAGELRGLVVELVRVVGPTVRPCRCWRLTRAHLARRGGCAWCGRGVGR